MIGNLTAKIAKNWLCEYNKNVFLLSSVKILFKSRAKYKIMSQKLHTFIVSKTARKVRMCRAPTEHTPSTYRAPTKHLRQSLGSLPTPNPFLNEGDLRGKRVGNGKEVKGQRFIIVLIS